MAAMTFVKHAPPLQTPIAWEASGAARVGGTRVRLEFVVWSHKAGETPEQIQDALPTLELADIYAVITYYLRNTEEVEAYLRKVEEAEEKVFADIDAQHPDNASLLARLETRRDAATQQGKQAS